MEIVVKMLKLLNPGESDARAIVTPKYLTDHYI